MASLAKKDFSETEIEDSTPTSDDEESDDISDGDVKNANDVSKAAITSANERAESRYLTFVCNTLDDFPGEEDGDLPFTKGELLTVLKISKNGWWEAENSDGRKGIVPSNFLKVPDKMKTLIEEALQSESHESAKHWKHLRHSMRKAHAFGTALHGFGAFPLGFHNSLLADMLNKDKSYSMEQFLIPKLNDCGLSFDDLFWESPSLTLKPKTTVLQKIIRLVALQEIIQPPSSYEITSRHIRMCLHDGNKVLSNIHTVKAKFDRRTPKIWTFNSKISADGSCLEEGEVFIRSNKLFATLGILFEICVTYKKGDSSEIAEMSCGWSFMRLLNDSGLPVKSRTKILKVHDSIPFQSHLDSPFVSIGSLKQFATRNKHPRMVVSISNLKRSSNKHIGYLPSTLIGSVSGIPLLSLYRKIISDDLLERSSFDSAELIESPFLTNFPRAFNEPDLIDVLRKLWADKVKNEKSHDVKKDNFKKIAFKTLFMETIFLLLNCCSLPPFSVGNPVSEQERKTEIARIVHIFRDHKSGAASLSSEIEFKPLSICQLSTSIF